ncbi:FecR domain-containing protein [Candidatus Omnitrophota bacterium]
MSKQTQLLLSKKFPPRYILICTVSLLFCISLALSDNTSTTLLAEDNLSSQKENVITIKDIEGLVQIKKGDEAGWKRASAGDTLTTNHKIRTLLESRAELLYSDGSTLTLRENSILDIKDISYDLKTGKHKREIKLNLGGMKYKVTPLREKGSEFKIHSSTAIVGVTGTEGMCATGGEGKPTRNTLIEGSTYNTDEDGEGGRPLKPGNTWEINEDAESGKHTSTDDEIDTNEYDEIDHETAARFDAFIVLFNQKKAEGYIVDETILERLTQAMMDRDYPALIELLDEAELKLSEAKKPADPKAQEVTEALEAARKEIEAKEAEGYDLKDMYLLFYQAEEAYVEEKYDAALDLTEQIKLGLLSLVEAEDGFLERSRQLMDEISEKAELGFMVEESIDLAKKSDIAYRNGDKAGAEAFLQKAREMLFQARRIIPQELLDALASLKEEILAKKTEGFDVIEVEELLDLVDRLLLDDKYIEAGGLLREIGEKLSILTKTLPKEMAYLLKAFEEKFAEKEAMGFDLAKLQNLMRDIYEAKEAGDFEKLNTLLLEGATLLKGLELPVGLSNRLKEFTERLQELKESGLVTTEIENLSAQIDAALAKEDLNLVRQLLDKAEELLRSLKDTEPPRIQVSDLEYTEDSVLVSGVASDNVKVDEVNVNGGLASLDEAGSFNKELLLTSLLREVVVIAKDTEGNESPEIIIAIPEEKLSGLSTEDPSSIPELDATLSYTEDGVLVTGKTDPGAIITAGDLNVTADTEGEFSLTISGSAELVEGGLTLTSQGSNGNISPEVKLDAEDKWLPKLEVEDVQLYDNTPPSLKMDPLSYQGDLIVIKGNSIDSANITIQGNVQDTGLGVESLTINGQGATLETGGVFKHTVLLAIELTSIDIAVLDKAGNKIILSKPIDLFLYPAIVIINDREVNVDEKGDFSIDLPQTADLKEITVQAKDKLGNETTPVRLMVADRISPSISLGDIYYEIDSVKITGQTEADSLISDSSGILFQDPVSVDAVGLFTIEVPRPQDNVTGTLVAQDASGNISEGIEVTIEALKDEKPPNLTVANLIFRDDLVIVSGIVEDDTGIKSVTINDEEVEVSGNAFYKELPLSADLVKVVVVATDLSGKTDTIEQVTEDGTPPTIFLEDLGYEEGYCIVKGTATDNLGLKEVTVNGIPIYIDLPAGGDFEYKLAITAGLENVVASAIDLYGNYQETEPKEIVPPVDHVAPVLTLNELAYGSPKAIVSGTVTDNIGLRSVLVNDRPIDFYEDGSFKVELDITIGSPNATLNDAIYTEEFVIISGTVKMPTQEPDEVRAIAEDLAGNKSMEMKRDVNALDLESFKVLVNGLPVDLNEGAFKKELILEQGMGDVDVQVYDSLGNASLGLSVPLETAPPILEVNEEVYEGDAIIVSGKASDELSGLAEILINNASIDFDGDGAFLETLPISESTVTIVALDRVGNMTSSIPIEVSPPDRSLPLFVVGLNPVPATIGKDLTITIDVLDTKTRQPEMLEGTPTVKAALSDGETRSVEMSGAGASFYGALQTTGLPAGLITFEVEGKDTAGNLGNVKEGLDNVLLNTTDTSAPSFSVSLTPPPPSIVGTEVTVNAAASETLKSLPNGTVTLPDGTSFGFALEGTLTGTNFTSTLSIPADTIPGTGTINLTDAIDLAGNEQSSPAVFSFQIEPEKVKASLPLRIEFSEITNERILVKGITSSQAIVHIALGELKVDIPSDDNGFFDFIKAISALDLERMRELGASILLDCHATNYAGLISEKISLNIPLPAALEEIAGGENFTIDVSPLPLAQGETAQIDIASRRRLREVPNVSIRLSNGRTDLIEITGSGRTFQGTYKSTQATSIGQAIIQVKSLDLFESRPYMIVPSSETYESMAGAGFFTITANPDPLPIGKELDISVTTERPIMEIPTLNIRLPNGRLDNIALSGEGMQFNGKYLSPTDTYAGPAELIVNMGKRNESRRPFGIVPPYGRRFIDEGHIFTFSNPRPVDAGGSLTVTVKSRSPLEEIPVAELRTSDGNLIPITLSGSTPGQMFTATVNIPEDASFGPAVIIVKDLQGNIIDEHPTEITPGFAGVDMEVEAFMVPSPATPGQVVMINVNSMGEELDFRSHGKLIFSDGLITPFNLEGPIPGMQFSAQVTIPLSASLGPVNIMIIDEEGDPIGGGQGYISRTQRGGGAGEIRISVMPPNPMPGDPLEISMYSEDNLQSIRVILDVPEKGPKDIPAEGPIPGNRFRAHATFPRDARPMGSRIDIIFDRGAGEETQSLFLEGRPEEGNHRPPELNPYPPMPGQPLVITLHAPFIIDFAPDVRVIYANGDELVATNGPIPGDRFTGTLPNVAMPVTAIDVIAPSGEVLATLPIEIMGGGMAAPHIEIMPQPLMPGMPADLMLEFPGEVFSLPTADIKLETGRVIPVTLTGQIPGNMFRGMFNISHDTPYGQANLEVYIDGQPVPGGRAPVHIGGDTGPVTGDMLGLMVFPGATGELNLDWNLLPRAEKHEIHYEASGIPIKTIDIGRTSHYFQTGLEAETEYKVTVIAFDRGRREITRSDYYVRTIRTSYDMGFPLYAHTAGPGNLQVTWEHQPSALRYDLYYIQGSGDPSTQAPRPVGNATSYSLSNLAPGMYKIQVEAILSTGETMLSEVREEYVSSVIDYGRPPIELTPYPPVVGMPLDIDVMLPMTVPGYPSLKAQYSSQGEESFTMSGSVPGSNFHGYLPSVKETITAINLYNPMTGELKYSHPISGDTYGPAPGATPHDLWVRIGVDPEPAVGSDLNIDLDFNQEIDFEHAGLSLFVGFVGGREIEIPISGSGPAMSYQGMLSASQHSEVIETIGVEGSRGVVPEEYINTQASGGVKAMLYITPNPPMMGTDAQIQVSIVDADTYQPRSIDILPEVEIEFDNGVMRALTVSGTLPGSEFSAEITAAIFTSPLTLIDVNYDGVLVGSKAFDVMGPTGPSGPGAPTFSPDPPSIGQPLNLVFDLPSEDPPADMPPIVRINYGGGVVPASEDMEMAGATPGRHFEGYLAMIKGPANSADFIHPMTGNIEYTHYFSVGYMDSPGGTISVAPNDPPVPDTTLEVTYNATQMVYERPTIEIHYMDNSMESLDAEGPIPGETFSISKYLNKPVSRIEAWDPQHTLIWASRHFADDGAPGEGTIIVTPDPPYPYTTLNIQVTTDNYQSSLPTLKLFYTDYTVDYPVLTGTLPGTSFNADYYITKDPERIELLDYNQNMIAVRYFDYGWAPGGGTIGVTPDPPYAYTTVGISVSTDNPQSGVPIVKIFYADSSIETTPPVLVGELYGTSFSVDFYALKTITRIEILDSSSTNVIAARDFDTGGGGDDWTIETAPANPYAYTTINVTITTDVAVSVLPTLKLKYADGTEDFSAVLNGALPGSSFTTNYYITKDLARTEAFDNYGEMRSYMNYGGGDDEQEFGPTFTPDPPTVGASLSMVLDTDPYEPPLYGYPTVRINYVSGTSPASENMQVSGAVPGRHFTGYLSNVIGLVETAEFIDPSSGTTVHTYYFVEGLMPALEDSTPTLSISPDPPTVGTSLQFTVTATASVRAPFIEIFYVDGTTFEPVVSGDDPGMSFTASLGTLTKSIDRIEVLSGLNDPSPDEIVITHYVSGDITALENSSPELTLTPDPPTLETSLQFTLTTTTYVDLPRIEILYDDGSTFEPVVSGDNPGMSFTAYLSNVTKPIDRIDIISGPDDPTPDAVALTHYVSGDVLALNDANASPTITISPDPPEVDDYFEVTITTAELVRTPDVEILYMDSSSYDLPLTGADPGMSFTGSLSPLTKTIDEIKLFSGQDDAYPDEFIITKEIVLGTLAYPANVWIESGGAADEAAINWDSVPEADGYIVYYSISSPSYHSSDYNEVVGSNITREVVTGLTGGYTYYFTVSAYADDGRESGYDTEESKVIGSDTPGGGTLTLTTPTPSGEFGEIDFDNVSPGTTSSSATITIENTGTTAATLRMMGGSLRNVSSPYNSISASNVNFADGYSIPASSSESRSISVDVPSGIYSGDYVTTPANRIKLYDDVNGSGYFESGESFVEVELWLTVGAGGLDTVEDGVQFTATAAGAYTTSKIIHVENTSGGALYYIRIEPGMLYREGGDPIPSGRITFDLNSTYPETLEYGETTTSYVYVDVPSGTVSGTYQGVVIVYSDTDYDGTKDIDEPFVSVLLQLPVSAGVDHFAVTHDGAAVEDVAETITITAEDSGDTTVTSYSPASTVTLSVSGVFGNFSEDSLTTSDFISGVATVTFTPTGTGSATITATDQTTTSYTGSSTALTVTAAVSSTVANLSALNRGTGGIVDLTWTDSDADTDHYHVYYRRYDGSLALWDCTPNKAIQVTGLTDDILYYFVVRPSDEYCTEIDENTTEVSATPTVSTPDITPPTFAGITAAYATSTSQQVAIEFGYASDKTPTVSYGAYYGTNASTIFDNTPDEVSPPSDTIEGLTNGTLYYFAVRAIDGASPSNEEMNTRMETATPYASVDHITITATNESAVGNPVLVEVTAYSSGDDSEVNTSFADPVKIQIIESTDYGQPRYILSIQDRVTGDIAEVAMASGVGYFTVDAIDQTQVNISTQGITSNTQQISFGGAAESTIYQFSIDGASTAKTGSAGNDGALFWLSALDDSGKVVTNYTGSVDIDIGGDGDSTSALLDESRSAVSGTHPNYSVDFYATDNGQKRFYLTNTASETVTVDADDGSKEVPGNFSIDFSGVDGYLLESAGQYTISTETIGSRIKYTAYAVADETPLNGYNGTATWELAGDGEDIANNSAMAIPSTITFSNGIAEFYVENSEYEEVQFRIKDSSYPDDINSDVQTAKFLSSDITAPELLRAEAETPFLIHLYFSEEIDSTNALTASNYTGVGTVTKVCWYEDEVTVHLGGTGLAGDPGLGETGSITIGGESGDDIKDLQNNYIGSNPTENFTVPNVDYQGSGYGSSDWLEIQTSPSSVAIGSDRTIHVVVYHKNACGYMTGSNAINRATDVSGTITIQYTGDTGRFVGTPPATPSISDGVSEFDIVVNFNDTAQSVSLQADFSGVTSGTATIEAD